MDAHSGRHAARTGRSTWPVALLIVVALYLIGVRLALNTMGAQSWYEGLITFPDFIAWLWAIALVVLLAGVVHGVLAVRARRDTHRESMAARPVSST